MKRKIGYARVSTIEQDLNLQVDALTNEGCDPSLIFTDKISGAKSSRPGLEKCLEALTKGDTLVVWRLDRLMFNIFSALSQFERRLIQERTNAGLAAARARGKNGGRPRTGINNPKVQMAKQMHQNNTVSIESICESLAISRATFYRYLVILN